MHDMMDDISEQNEIAEEISSALSAPVGFNQELDDVSPCTYMYTCMYMNHVLPPPPPPHLYCEMGLRVCI